MATAFDKALRRALLGGQRHGKRNQYGHWFQDGQCIACGLTKAEFAKRFQR